MKHNNFPISFEELSHVPKDEPFICMFSGGKDCSLALSIMQERNPVKGLLHCVSASKNISLFHLQSHKIVKTQAEAMGLPVNIIDYSALDRWPKLVNTYKQLAEQGIKSILFGDQFLEGHALLQINMCISAGLTPRMPLWHMPQSQIQKELKERKINCIITAIGTPLLSDSWLGKTFDDYAFEHFKSLGIDPLGENGEYHTTLVDADFLKKQLVYRVGNTIDTVNSIRRIGITMKIAEA